MPFPDIQISAVRDDRELDAFIRFPWTLYRNDPHWVPPLVSDVKKLLDRNHHPFHQHAEVEYFLARRRGARGGHDGEVVGRIAAIVNHAHNEFHEEKTGFFGFFEVVDEEVVAALLLQAAADWLTARGMERMRGPASFSSNEEFGLLVDGFGSAPMVMMTYNPEYYIRLLERHGLVPAKDLVAYYMTDETIPERLLKLLQRVEDRAQITVRPLDKKRFDQEVELIRDVYNSAWERNWGFVPMTNAEIDHMAKELKPVVDPDLVAFAEKDGKTIGFALALPDLNQALRRANGKLWPFGLVKMILEMKKIRRIRVLTLGVLAEYRKLGADVLLYSHLYRRGTAKGYRAGEFSWILEDNVPMRRALEQIGASVYKTYRIYEQPLGAGGAGKAGDAVADADAGVDAGADAGREPGAGANGHTGVDRGAMSRREAAAGRDAVEGRGQGRGAE
ncbi:MAG: N-acetyltransferase [Candidatus Eisenbacteria bacterium]